MKQGRREKPKKHILQRNPGAYRMTKGPGRGKPMPTSHSMRIKHQGGRRGK